MSTTALRPVLVHVAPIPGPPGHALPRLAGRLVVSVPAAAAAVLFHLATSRLYGLHRDEFYYLARGHHLSWGYVDHPPLTPFLYRAGEVLFGRSATGLHVIPAILAGVLVIVGALVAREFGGGSTAQGLTALVAAVGPLYLTPAHFLGTVTEDVEFRRQVQAVLLTQDYREAGAIDYGTRGSVCRAPSAATTRTGGGGGETPASAPRPSRSASRPVRWMPSSVAASRSRRSAARAAWSIPRRTAALSRSAGTSASPGPRSGPGCATTTD